MRKTPTRHISVVTSSLCGSSGRCSSGGYTAQKRSAGQPGILPRSSTEPPAADRLSESLYTLQFCYSLDSFVSALAACHAPQCPTTFAQTLIIATQKIESGNMTVYRYSNYYPKQRRPAMKGTKHGWVVEFSLDLTEKLQN